MATIVTRETTQTDGTSPKGSPLTNAEVDTNFINLNDDKVEVSGAIIFQAKAGEALSKGDVVYVSGVSGNEPVVSKADADDAAKMPAYGLAEADANLNAAVNVVTFGTLYDLNTSSFAAGETVYVSTTAGAITTTAPTGESSLLQNIGTVIRSHASAGSIKVGGAGRTNATPNLNDGNVFIGNASNQAAARALTTADIQSGTFADARIAESNVTQHQAALSITESQISDLQAYLTAESDTLDSVTDRGATTTNAITVGNLTSTGIDDNATSTAITIDASQNVGIGTASPSNQLHLNTTAASNVIQLTNSATGTGAGDGMQIVTSSLEMQLRNREAGPTTFYTSNTERMRIDSSGNVGVGTTSPLSTGSTYGSITASGSAGGEYYLATGGTAKGNLFNYSANANHVGLAAVDSSGELLFSTGGYTERMRIDSSGKIGINNSAPFNKLDIKSSPTTALASAESQLALRNNNGRATYVTFDNSADLTIYNTAAGDASGGNTVFHQTSGEAMRIDSSGNVGINATVPSAFNQVTGQGRLVVGGGAADEGMTIYSSASNSGSIAFADGASGTAQWRGVVQYVHSDDSMRLFTTNTLRMTINSSGNVGIGAPAVSGVNAPLDVDKAPTYNNCVANFGEFIPLSGYQRGVVNINGRVNGTDYDAGLSFVRRNAGNSNWLNSIIAQDNAGDLYFGTAGAGSSASTERMRITSSGRININHQTSGTAGTGSFIVGANSFYIQASENSSSSTRAPIVFSAVGGANESMRIDSGGHVLIGRSSTGASAADYGMNLYSTGIIYLFANAAGNDDIFRGHNSAGTNTSAIEADGDYIDLSDSRFKQNIVDAPSVINTIKSMPVRSFDWKDRSYGQTYGFVAQELNGICPEVVKVPESEEDVWGVRNSKVVPMLVKAVQEQQAMIEELKAEVAALKGA